MFDKSLTLSILKQVCSALEKIVTRTVSIQSAADFTGSPTGMEKLDSVCMLFMAIGEALKNVDKITKGALLSQYPEIDWKGIIGFRNIIAHQYFDIDAEQVFWICQNETARLYSTIEKMIKSLG